VSVNRKLRTCPWCNGECVFVEEQIDYDGLIFDKVQCTTAGCPGLGGLFDSQDEAATEWNTRYDDWRTDEVAEGKEVLVYHPEFGIVIGTRCGDRFLSQDDIVDLEGALVEECKWRFLPELPNEE